MSGGEQITAWRPEVPGVGEVLHAHFTEHAYPQHVHGAWTVMLVDAGAVVYDLDHRRHVTQPGAVTVLPPDVPHDGRSVAPGGFDKRVVYLDERWLPLAWVEAAVDRPSVLDRELARAVDRLHTVLTVPGEDLRAEVGLVGIAERLGHHLGARDEVAPPDRTVARDLRDRLDGDLAMPPSVSDVARDLGRSPGAVVRAFTREFGIAPHRYLTGRRIDAARRLLLDGVRPADVAAEVGFYDQAHLTRHFRHLLGVPPGEFARSAA